MEKKIAEQMNEMTKNMVDSMLRMQEINDRTVQRLAQQQFEAAGDYMNTGVKQLKSIGETKDVKEAMSKQVDLASELSEKMMGHAKQAMDVLNQSKSELNELVEKNLNTIIGMMSQTKD